MYCGNCGKEIDNETRFCPFCGAEQNAVVIPGVGSPSSVLTGQPTETEMPDTLAMPISGTPMSPPTGEPAEAAGIMDALKMPISSIPTSAPISEEAVSSVPIDTVTSMGVTAAMGIPTPNSIPTSNMGVNDIPAPVQTLPPKNEVRYVPAAEAAIKDTKKPRPERKYSLKHIVMCLAAAAVMAVAAGVFAGLYFSVIFTK